MLTKRMEKRLEDKYAKMQQLLLNKSWRHHPTKQQLYDHLPFITESIQVRRNRHAGYYWRSKDEFISDVLLWTRSYGRAKAAWPATTYIQQLCADTGCKLEDLPEGMDDREMWRERVRGIHTDDVMMMMMMYNLAEYHQQCQKSLCVHRVNELLLSCFHCVEICEFGS